MFVLLVLKSCLFTLKTYFVPDFTVRSFIVWVEDFCKYKIAMNKFSKETPPKKPPKEDCSFCAVCTLQLNAFVNAFS